MGDSQELTFRGTAGTTHAILELPDGPGPHPGVVLVDGSGGNSRHEWGGWPRWVGWPGVATLRHDKPGTGDTAGDWRDQSFDDRAADTIAAVAALAACDGVDGDRVGIWGASQGGWVAPLVASRSPQVAFVGLLSASGVTPAAQEAFRIERALQERGLAGSEAGAGMEWFHERTDRLRAGEAPESVFASVQGHAAAPWAGVVDEGLDRPAALAFIQRCFDFDVLPALASLRCPLMAMWGAADTLVPARLSRELFAAALARGGHRDHELHVFPGGDHGCFMADPADDVPRHEQFAPGFLDTLHDWLRRVGSIPAPDIG